MKNTKRLLCLALVLAMLSAYIIAPVSAEGATTVTDADSLQAAMDIGGDIVLASDIELFEPVTVPGGVTVNLDASGYTITVTPDVDTPIVCNGNLNIIGGTFSWDVSAYVPATHRSVLFNDGAYYIFENKTFIAGEATQVVGGSSDVLRYFFTPDQKGIYAFYHEETEDRCNVFNISAVNAATGEYAEGEYFLNGNYRGWYGSFTAGQTYCISLLVEYSDSVDMAVNCAAGTDSLQQFTIDPSTMEAHIYPDEENYGILRISTTPVTTLGHPISWESSDPTVVEIDTTADYEYGTCKINFLKPGIATITATIDNGAAGGITTATRVVTVKQPHEHHASLEFVSAEPPTCQSTYLLEHYYCNQCYKYFKDALGSEETTLDKLTHAPSHSMLQQDEQIGDCINTGIAAHFYCFTCGNAYADELGKDLMTEEELRPYGPHNLIYNAATPGASGQPSILEHWWCSYCGNYFADADGKEPLDSIYGPIVYEELKIGTNTITIPGNNYQTAFSFTPKETGEYTLYQTYTLYQPSYGVTVTPKDAVASIPQEQWSAYTGSLYAIGNRWTLEKDVTYIIRFTGGSEMSLDYELQKVVAPTAIAFSADTLRGYEGSISNSQPYFAPIYAKPTGEITYQVGEPAVAEINKFGLLNHIAPGTTTLTATVDGLSATCNVQTFAAVQLTPGKENVTNNSTCDTITYHLTITHPGDYSLTAKAPEFAGITVFDHNGNYLFGEEIGETETLTTTLDLVPGTYYLEARPMVHNTDVSILVKADKLADPATSIAFEKAQYETKQYLSLGLNPTGTPVTDGVFMNLVPTPADTYMGMIQSVTISDTKVLELMKFEDAPIAYQYLLYAAAPGTATVTVTLDTGLTASCQVTVNPLPELVPGYNEKMDVAPGNNPKIFTIKPKADGVYALYRTTTVNEVYLSLLDATLDDPFMDPDPLNKEGYIGGQYNLKAGKEYLVVVENASDGDASLILYFDMISHTHKLTKVAAKAATYTEAGNIEHYVCDACGKKFSDSTAAKEITDVTLPQLIEVVGEKAEVSEGAVDTAIKEAVAAGSTGEVKLDLTKNEVVGEDSAPVSSAVLPVAALEKVAESDAKLTLTKADATVTIDTKALEAISEKADGASVTLVVEQVKAEDLNTAQQAAVKDKEVAVVISAELINTATQTPIGKEADGGFGGGTVTVQIPFTPEAGTSGEDYTIFYIADDGTVTEIETSYKDGALIMELAHFSEYVVVKTGKTVDPNPTTPTEPTPTEPAPTEPTPTEPAPTEPAPTTPSAPKPNKPSSGSNPATGDTALLVLPMLLVLSAAMVIFFSRKRKHA